MGIATRMHIIVNAFSSLAQDTPQPLTTAHLMMPLLCGKHLKHHPKGRPQGFFHDFYHISWQNLAFPHDNDSVIAVMRHPWYLMAMVPHLSNIMLITPHIYLKVSLQMEFTFLHLACKTFQHLSQHDFSC